MGSSMGKCSYGDDPYYKRRRKTEIGDNFSKEYSEYWRCPPRKKTSDTFVIERNEYTFSNSAMYASSAFDNRRPQPFVSSFSKTDKSSQFHSGFAPVTSKSSSK
ncbi:unnamed protein product [Cylicocyclus nassatus]|uniref:Uncharacterized protein n=1 Tax=Cylicocyclus nassatus TaxID=53992 RepID=A0AA36MBM3_CYLNA|nr:unnamed protein product [Cylicocyclus nassatus]